MRSERPLPSGGPAAHAAGSPRSPDDSLARAAAALLVAAALLCVAGCGPPSPAPGSQVPRHTRVDGLTYSEFAESTLARRLRADELVVVPKRLGILQFSSLTELVLTGARVSLFERTGGDARAGAAALDAIVPSRGFPLPGLANVRRVAGATIHGLEFTVLRESVPLVRIEAKRATADGRSGDLVLREFRLVHIPSSRTVSADRATWRRHENDFVVRGEYTITDGEGTSHGRGLRIDSEFRRPDRR